MVVIPTLKIMCHTRVDLTIFEEEHVDGVGGVMSLVLGPSDGRRALLTSLRLGRL